MTPIKQTSADESCFSTQTFDPNLALSPEQFRVSAGNEMQDIILQKLIEQSTVMDPTLQFSVTMTQDQNGEIMVIDQKQSTTMEEESPHFMKLHDIYEPLE